MPWEIVEPVVDRSVRGLCVKPYPLHKKGCPNFGKKAGCPPQCPTIDQVLDLSKPVWVIWNVFPFGAHVEKLRAKYPHWSQRQLACCLYWQPRARKQLREVIREFAWKHGGLKLVGNPEAAGVNLTATMAKAGHDLEWPPKTVSYQVVMAGTSTRGEWPDEQPNPTEKGGK